MGETRKRDKLRAFFMRRKINALGLLVITIMSALITLICALTGFSRTDVLAMVTILLVLLGFLQAFKLKKSFRTIRSSRGLRKKRSHRPHAVREDAQEHTSL